MRGNRGALVVAVVIAGVSAITHLTFIAANPAWSLLVIAFDVIVIYAIVAHGRGQETSSLGATRQETTMSDQAVHGTASGSASATHGHTARRTGWVGWVYFAGTMLVLVGTFSLIEGLVALFNDQYYVPTRQGLLVFDITGWGWIHLIMGILAAVVGVGLFTGATWARIGGVAFAVLNAIVQLAFLSAYPLWATIVITLDILIIWALIVHGDEAKSTERW